VVFKVDERCIGAAAAVNGRGPGLDMIIHDLKAISGGGNFANISHDVDSGTRIGDNHSLGSLTGVDINPSAHQRVNIKTGSGCQGGTVSAGIVGGFSHPCSRQPHGKQRIAIRVVMGFGDIGVNGRSSGIAGLAFIIVIAVRVALKQA